MSANMSSTNTDYNSAYANYQNAMQNYKDTANKFTGESGYQKTLEQGSKGANVTAGGVQQQAQNAYRSAGMNKAQAANLAAGQGASAYQNSFENQQQSAANQNANAVTAAGNTANQRSTAVQMQQQEGQNKYNRSWGNFGNTLGIVGSFVNSASDERLKESVKISDVRSARDISKDMDKYFTKRDYKSLICRGVSK